MKQLIREQPTELFRGSCCTQSDSQTESRLSAKRREPQMSCSHVHRTRPGSHAEGLRLSKKKTNTVTAAKAQNKNLNLIMANATYSAAGAFGDTLTKLSSPGRLILRPINGREFRKEAERQQRHEVKRQRKEEVRS